MSAPRRRTASTIPPAIDWREGLLLAPQHFQLASHRAEALMHYHASAASPFPWGCIEYEAKKIENGILTITAVEAVFPDGLVISHPRRDGGGARDLSINLNQHLAEIEEGKHTVFLTTAARQPGDVFSQRYESCAETVPDENTALDDLSVDVLHPKLELSVADYLHDGLVGFPIARVHVRSGAVEEAEDYEPPWLRVGQRSRLHDACDRVAGRLRTEAVDLAAAIVHDSASTQGAQLIEARMLIHSLVSCLPQLEVLLQSEAAHPYQLYLALASIAGNLAPGVVPKSVDPYDHENLLRIFVAMERRIDAVIRGAVHSPYTTHPFKATEDGLGFRLLIQRAWLERRLMLGVRAPAGVKLDEVHQWVEQSAIGSEPQIGSLRLLRKSGVKRERPRESEVLPSTGDIFYELKKPYGENLLPLENLVISNASREARPDQIVLYVGARG